MFVRFILVGLGTPFDPMDSEPQFPNEEAAICWG